VKNFRVELTNWAHALAAYVGALIAAAGGGATIATFFGAHINSLPSIQGNGVAGLILALASKFIDSAHNAVTTTQAPQQVIATVSTSSTNTAPAPVVVTTPAPPAPAPPGPPLPTPGALG